jgi:O-antigen ligase
MVLILAYIATGRNVGTNLAKFVIIGAAVLVPLLLSPFGSRLTDFLPFIGSIDAGSVTYRETLWDHAIVVIERNPWFGTNDYRSTPELQEMMQGEHIIDVVNTYLVIALGSGLVGLSLFLSFFASILVGLWRVLKIEAVRETGLETYVRSSIAILGAIMVTIATASSIDYIPYIYWSFAGLSVALIRIAYEERAAVPRAANAIQIPA